MKFFLIFLFLKLISSSQITIPFKKIIKEKLTKNNLMKNLINNDLQIEITLGSPPQKFPVLIKLGHYPTFILTTNCPLNIKKFNTSLSSTFREFKKFPKNTYNFNCDNATYSTDNFNLGNEKILVPTLYFLIADNMTTESFLTSGELGLAYKLFGSAESLNLIDQLKNKKLIENKVFYLDYNNENEGNLFIGNYPHLINKKKYNYEQLYKAKIFEGITQRYWDLSFEYIYFTDNIIEKDVNVHCEYEFGFIEGTQNYYNIIKQSFFEKYLSNKDCVEVDLNNINQNFYIECNKNINIKNFPILSFENKELKLNFTFNYEELFYQFEDKLYFLIVFRKSSINWKFGNVFFKKYQIYFDRDNKIFGVYLKNKSNINIPYTTFIIVILILALIVCGSLLYYFINLLKRKRKIRANELEDNFEYIAS